MAEPTRPGPSTPLASPESTDPHYRSYSILFQAWLLLFLAVICFALVNYLISYIPR